MKKKWFAELIKINILFSGACLLLSGNAMAVPITSATASYTVYTVSPGTALQNTGTTSAMMSYFRPGVTASFPGTSGAKGSTQSAVNASGSAASSSYENGLGMNYEHYISPEDGARLMRPQQENIDFRSTATWQETFVASATGEYTWTTIVPDATIHMYYDTFAKNLPASLDLTAGFEGVVTANNTEIFRYGSKSFFTSGGGSSSQTWGIYPAPLTQSHSGDPTFLEFTGYWNTGPHSFAKSLGQFNADDLITIEMSISTYIYGTGQQNGADVFLGDPGNLTADNNVSGYLTPSSDPYSSGSNPVPEPATMLLFGSGIMGLVATKVRKKITH